MGEHESPFQSILSDIKYGPYGSHFGSRWTIRVWTSEKCAVKQLASARKLIFLKVGHVFMKSDKYG